MARQKCPFARNDAELWTAAFARFRGSDKRVNAISICHIGFSSAQIEIDEATGRTVEREIGCARILFELAFDGAYDRVSGPRFTALRACKCSRMFIVAQKPLLRYGIITGVKLESQYHPGDILPPNFIDLKLNKYQLRLGQFRRQPDFFRFNPGRRSLPC
jgi:hypothetical protein